jgi:uncharacterized BrkB/YihY/UPF0761 family membrane protein
MDVIPHVRLVFAIVLAGVLLLIFNNVIGIYKEYFPPDSVYTNFAMMLWNGMVIIILLVEGVKYLRALQMRRLQ